MEYLTGKTKKANFILQPQDIDFDKPEVIQYAFKQLLDEVWQFAPEFESTYKRELPFDYVVHRFAQQTIGDFNPEDLRGEIAGVLSVLSRNGLEIGDSCTNLMLPYKKGGWVFER